jgi:hypothetical protein
VVGLNVTLLSGKPGNCKTGAENSNYNSSSARPESQSATFDAREIALTTPAQGIEIIREDSAANKKDA